jgi:ABC-type antimicrobial peptide transport system permease subunit
MQGLVGIVLLLCCVNVSGLMMSKVYARQHEFAIRKAIRGACLRLIRQYLLESLTIALAGAARRHFDVEPHSWRGLRTDFGNFQAR